jgi:pyruvate formate-lyase activating enzyme-like uncharacterized protein
MSGYVWKYGYCDGDCSYCYVHYYREHDYVFNSKLDFVWSCCNEI